MATRIRSVLGRVRNLFPVAGLGLMILACNPGDVGAPCNHGQVEPPESKLVTFPALSCDELLCVYADEAEPPADSCDITNPTACNDADPQTLRFECVLAQDGMTGTCRLRNEYVLERSMCSKRCSTDDDCKDGGVTDQVVVDNTECSTGFACARIQTLGQFCCEKLCVCRDDLSLATAMEIEVECAAGTQMGCCTGPDVDPNNVPEACGNQGG